MPLLNVDASVLPMTAKPTPSFVTVTPEIAERWLKGNTFNRPRRSIRSAKYGRDMAAGRWTLNNDAVCFTSDGQLVNGQHRLQAVVDTETSVVMLIIRNMPLDAMVNMDSGAKRTVGDALGLNGERNTALLASITKQAMFVADGRIYRDSQIMAQATTSEIEDFLIDHPELRDATSIASKYRGNIDTPPTAIGVAYWLISNRNGTSLAEHFISQVATRTNEPAGSAILAVDSRLREIKRSNATFAVRNHVYLLLKGWNHYAADRQVRVLPIKPKGDFRLPEVAAWNRTTRRPA